jgi:hypothetical protein
MIPTSPLPNDRQIRVAEDGMLINAGKEVDDDD